MGYLMVGGDSGRYILGVTRLLYPWAKEEGGTLSVTLPSFSFPFYFGSELHIYLDFAGEIRK